MIGEFLLTPLFGGCASAFVFFHSPLIYHFLLLGTYVYIRHLGIKSTYLEFLFSSKASTVHTKGVCILPPRELYANKNSGNIKPPKNIRIKLPPMLPRTPPSHINCKILYYFPIPRSPSNIYILSCPLTPPFSLPSNTFPHNSNSNNNSIIKNKKSKLNAGTPHAPYTTLPLTYPPLHRSTNPIPPTYPPSLPYTPSPSAQQRLTYIP